MSKLTINAPQQGISSSPFVGYGDVRQLDIFILHGAIKLNNLTAKKSGTTVIGRVNWMVKNPATPAEVYALDADGKVYKSTDSGATWALMTGFTAGGAGQGLAIWKNYLFVARATAIDICGDGTATGITNANWSNSWAGMTLDTDALWHPMLVSKNDNKLYIGAGKYVASIDEATAPFAPGTAASYTATAQALDLPPNYRIKCVEELGNNLMLGTWQGTNVYDLRVADIFPWDRSSSSFGQPIVLNEFGIHAMLNIGNALIVLAGIDGQIYLSDGVGASPIAQIPQSIADISNNKYIDFYPGAICNYKKKVYFGVSSGGTATTIAGMGIYSLTRTSRGNILVNEHLISTGNDGDGEILKIGALLPITRDNLLIGWQDATTYGIDNITTSSFVTSYGGYFISPMYRVGTSNHTRKFQEVEINLARPLRTNEGVKLSYRSDLTASFTDFLTFDFATYAGKLSHTTILSKPTFDIPASELLQIKCSLTGTTTSPEFLSLILG
ncbi:MAG: hypothetical protein AAB706_01560 [Patescibacteria group bacterium]